MLSIRDVSKVYPNGVKALDRVDLAVEQGEILAIVGGSGCGKSTLLRLLGGLDLPSAGSIDVDNERVSAPHPAIGIVFQEPRLLPWLNVAQNIAFGIDQLPKAEQNARVTQALSLIGLEGYGNRLPKELSGGQAQRVAIARALVAKPKVLLMDEPFSALDPLTRHELQGQVIALWKAYKPTMVMVTHDAEEAVALADRATDLTTASRWPNAVCSPRWIKLSTERVAIARMHKRQVPAAGGKEATWTRIHSKPFKPP
jgi:sulfonate transport system ATP-binding protein